MINSLFGHAQFNDFEFDGVTRQYIFYAPSNLSDNAPLVIVLHGYSSDATEIQASLDMEAKADQYGFAVCYPRGTVDHLGQRFWNVGYPFHEGIETVDDVGFILALSAHLQTVENLAEQKTFLTGFSTEGDMCYRIACEVPEAFKAIASISGMMLSSIDCSPTPIPMFELHGTLDDLTHTMEIQITVMGGEHILP